MQNQDDHLQFLKRKIENIRFALFKAEHDCLLNIPNNIISTLKVDKEGYIWFFTSCGYYKKNMDKEFYGYLDYYQKGRNDSLRISGKANIIENTEDKHPPVSKFQIPNYQMILIKLKIMQAEYSENKNINPRTFKQKFKINISDLL